MAGCVLSFNQSNQTLAYCGSALIGCDTELGDKEVIEAIDFSEFDQTFSAFQRKAQEKV